jgi:hypothetical protein
MEFSSKRKTERMKKILKEWINNTRHEERLKKQKKVKDGTNVNKEER